MSDILRRNTMLGSSSSNNSGGGGTSTSGSYTVNLNGQWELTTTPANPDSALYDGVYRSASNYNVNNGVSTMYITIKDCSSFKIYIRSYAESNYDYVMISQLDQTISDSTSYSDTTLVKDHTRGNQQSGTALSNYTLVEYVGITSGEHTITVVYRKDSSAHSGDDRGYVLIPKLQSGGDSEGGEGSDEGPIDINNYLTIEALEDGLTAKLSSRTCEYCIDGDGVWNTLAANTTTPSINQGQVISFRGMLISNENEGIGTFSISKKCNLKGNCMSMLFSNNAKDKYDLSNYNFAFRYMFKNCINIINTSELILQAIVIGNGCYNSMFYGCSSLISTPVLPATQLTDYCYESMFNGCTSLITPPNLPATKLSYSCYNCLFEGCISLTTPPELSAPLSDRCYRKMFYGCTSLTKAPELPATTLADYCYYEMFSGCTSLTKAPELPATTLADYCYVYMFNGCTSLTTAPELPANKLATSCYSNMFNGCTSLTTAPELPATTLASYCYEFMFDDCTSLTKAPDLPANKLAYRCYSGMFYGCTSLTKAPELPATTLSDGCYHTMFSGCTSLTKAPELPATKLSYSCYNSMFTNCIHLSAAPELPATTLEEFCYYQMFFNCKSLTTAPELPSTTLKENCYERMFQDCKQLNYIKAMFTTIPSSSCTNGWVSYVSSTGIFVKNTESTWNVTGYNGIPSGWNVIEESPVEGYLTFSVEGHQYPFPVNNITIATWEEFISGEEGSVEFSISEDGSIYSNIMHNNLVYEGTSIFVNKYHTLINGYTYAIYQDTNPA